MSVDVRHGELAGYSSGCREACCRGAATAHAKRYRVRRSRQGPSRLPAEPTIAVLGYARAAGLSWRDIGRASGLSWQFVENIGAGRKPRVLRSTRDRLLEAVTTILDGRAVAIEDCRAAVAYASGLSATPDGHCWPVGPLREALEARYGSLGAVGDESMRRHLLRAENLPSVTAERYAVACGWMAHEIWPDWYEEG